MAEQVLQRNNHYYEQEGIDQLTNKGENFALMRVEVTGVLSHDDTNVYDENLFDEQVKPSFSNPPKMSRFERLLDIVAKKINPMPETGLGDLLEDVSEYSKAASGETTDNAREKFAKLRGLEINEIIAHSWGTEVVYAAILSGDIRPPKRLIVVGVPDNDREKWKLLAAMTGTEVHWVRADNDFVQDAPTAAQAIGLQAGKGVDFKAKWDAVCGGESPNPDICHPHKRKSKDLIVDKIKNIPGFIGHDRTEYYDALKRKGVLKDSTEQLQQKVIQKMEAEISRVKKDALNEALVEARELVAQAHEQAAAAVAQRKFERERAKAEEEANAGCEWIMLGGQPVCFRPPGAVSVAQAAVATPPVLPAREAPPEPFSTFFAEMKSFVESACRGNALYDRVYYYRVYDMQYKEYDAEQAAMITSRMDRCSRMLFNSMFEKARYSRDGVLFIDGKWTVDAMAQNARVPDYSVAVVRPAPSTGGGTYQREPAFTPPPVRAHDPEGEALRQARILAEENAMRRRWHLPEW